MIGHLLNRTVTVHRPQTTPDDVGGYTVAYVEVGEIRAQVNQPTPAERQLAAQFGANLSHVVHALYGEDVRRGDELGGELPSDVPVGSRLRVISAVSDSRSTYTRVECEITQAEQEA